MRHSLTDKRNPQYKDWTDEAAKANNLEFFTTVKRSLPKELSWTGAIGLIGGKSLTANSLRRAQSILRWDLRPSYWSHCFLIVADKRSIEETIIWECTLEPNDMSELVPERNGVTAQTLDLYQDPAKFPNVGLISFRLTNQDRERLLDRAADPNIDRLRFNLWDLLRRWLSYAWVAGQDHNPLADGTRMPSAAYVEMAYESIGIDLTPGASERNSSPEHFWQTALWWWEPFQKLKKTLRIDFCTREKQAVILPASTTRLPEP